MANKKHFTSLKYSIMTSTVVMVAASFFIIISLIFAVLLNQLKQTAESEFMVKGQKYANLFEEKIDNALHYLSITASILETQVENGTVDREQLQKTMLNIFNSYEIDGTSIMFEYNMYDGRDDEYVGSEYGTRISGKICWYYYLEDGATAYLPEALGNDIEFEESYYVDARDAGKPIYSGPFVYEIGEISIPMLTLTYPMYDKNNVFLGAVTVDIFLLDLYSQLQSEEIYENGYMAVTNDKDNVVYSPIYEDIGKTRKEAKVDYALPSKDELVVYSNTSSIINGKNSFVATIPVYISQLDRSFYVSVIAPFNEIYADGYFLMSILGLFSLIILFVILRFLIYSIVNPVKGITENANKITDGGYLINGDIIFNDIEENEKNKNEIYILSIALKRTLSQLNEAQSIKLEALELKHEKEKAEESSRTKSDFLARMSHEIRTPMNAIVGMVELILREDIQPSVYEHAISIKQASANLLAIINDILDFSKIESGKLEIIPVNYQFSSLINDVISIIRMRVMEKPILFTVNIDSGIPGLLIGDEVRVRQILLNLLSNACKYCEEGYISITVDSEMIDDTTVVLTIEIADSGIGIKEDDINKLFGDFVQVDMVKNKGVEGTGLGLAITRNLCLAMGGNISVHSIYGEGSTFTVELPQKFEKYEKFAVVENPTEKRVLIYETRAIYSSSIVCSIDNLDVPCTLVTNQADFYKTLEQYQYPYVFIASFLFDGLKEELEKLSIQTNLILLTEFGEVISAKNIRTLAMPAHSITIANILNGVADSINYNESKERIVRFTAPSARVLIVDDIVTNLKVAEGLMLPYKMQIDTCKSGIESIELLKINQYDLVFMDHMMPEMDGVETTQRIRALEGDDYKNIPIIALTANAVSGAKEMFLQNGFNGFLSKPIETLKLNAMLEKWISKEKQLKGKEPQNEVDKTNDFVDMLRTVPALSVDKALLVVGGEADTYENVVKLTVRLLPDNIDELNKLIETDLQKYAIAVHGIKGVLNNIGAYTLGETAFKLETLSKGGDLDACKEIHPAFIGELMDFSKTMTELVSKTGTTDKHEGDKLLLAEALPRLEEAVEFFDSALAIEILFPIGKSTYGQELDHMIEALIYALERFDFDKATELITALKGLVVVDEQI